MLKDTLYAFVEPAYMSSVWCARSIAGLQENAAKQHIPVQLLFSMGELRRKGVRTVALISAKADWTRYMVNELGKSGIKAVLVGAMLDDIGEEVSGPTFDRRALVERMVYYFYSAGRRRLACLGNEPEDLNDGLRKKVFLEAAAFLDMPVGEADVYANEGCLETCVARFLDNAHRYDGAICVNDYVAVHLLASARQRGISVPEQLFVAGSGNMMIGCCIYPTLTTSTLDYYEMGMQTVNIWSFLEHNLTVSAVSVAISCEIIARASTGFFPVPKTSVFDNALALKFTDSPVEGALLHLRRLENCLRQCDKTDCDIILRVLQGKSYEKIAGELFIVPGTVQYRLKKIYSALGLYSRKEFVLQAGAYITEIANLSQY